MKLSRSLVRLAGLVLWSGMVRVSIGQQEEVVFDADFNASQVNSAPFDQKAPAPDPFGGVLNLNAGTSVGEWEANSPLGMAIYNDHIGDPMAFFGVAGYDIEAIFSKEVSLSGYVEVSFDAATCCSSMNNRRENMITGEDNAGRVVFSVMTTSMPNKGGYALFLQTPNEEVLISSGVKRVIKSTIHKDSADLFRVSVLIQQGSIAVYSGDTELISGVPLYSEGLKAMSRLRFSGHSAFYDNIRVRGAATAFQQKRKAQSPSMKKTAPVKKHKNNQKIEEKDEKKMPPASLILGFCSPFIVG